MDLETKVLNDLDDKLHGLIETAVHKPTLARVVDKENKYTEEVAFAYGILYLCFLTHFTCAKERF